MIFLTRVTTFYIGYTVCFFMQPWTNSLVSLKPTRSGQAEDLSNKSYCNKKVGEWVKLLTLSYRTSSQLWNKVCQFEKKLLWFCASWTNITMFLSSIILHFCQFSVMTTVMFICNIAKRLVLFDIQCLLKSICFNDGFIKTRAIHFKVLMALVIVIQFMIKLD